MATKSGLLRFNDFCAGRIGWFVYIEATSDGKFKIEEPAKIKFAARPFVYETQYEDKDDKAHYCESYVLEFTYVDKTHPRTNNGYNNSLSFCEIAVTRNGVTPPWREYRSRVFRKKKQALKYIQEFNAIPTEIEILEAQRCDNFLTAMDNLPKPVFPAIEKRIPTYRNKKRFLRAPGTKLRRMAWRHDEAPMEYPKVNGLGSAYGIAYWEHRITRPAGALPIDKDGMPTEQEVATAEHLLTLPGSSGRRYAKKKSKKTFFLTYPVPEIFFPTIVVSPEDKMPERKPVVCGGYPVSMGLFQYYRTMNPLKPDRDDSQQYVREPLARTVMLAPSINNSVDKLIADFKKGPHWQEVPFEAAPANSGEAFEAQVLDYDKPKSPTEVYLADSAQRHLTQINDGLAKSGAGLVGLPTKATKEDQDITEAPDGKTLLASFIDENIKERAKTRKELLSDAEAALLDRVKAGQYNGMLATNSDTYKGLEDKGNVPPKPNEAS